MYCDLLTKYFLTQYDQPGLHKMSKPRPITTQKLNGHTITVLKPAYLQVESSNTSCLEAHAGFFRLLMQGIFDPYVLISKAC